MRNSLSDFSQVNLGKKEKAAQERDNENFKKMTQPENFKNNTQPGNFQNTTQAASFQNMTQAQANEMLFETVRKQKQNGTFDYQTLQKQVNSLKSFLPEKDFANLQKLLESLR